MTTIHAYIYTYMYTYTYNTYTCIYTYMHTYIHTYIHAYIHTYVHINNIQTLMIHATNTIKTRLCPPHLQVGGRLVVLGLVGTVHAGVAVIVLCVSEYACVCI